MCSELVDEVIEAWNAGLESLSLSDGFDELATLGGSFEGVTWDLLPMVEDALREGTAGGGGTESLGETKGLSDREVSLYDEEGGSGNGLFTDNDTSSLSEGLIDATHGVVGALDLAEEDGLNEAGLGSQLRGVVHTSSCGDDLTTTSVNGVSVKGHVHNVELDTSHVLVSEGTLLSGPLEGSFHGVLDLIEILDSGGLVQEDVGAGCVGTEAPDLECVVLVPLVLLGEQLDSLLGVLLRGDQVLLDVVGQVVSQRLSLHEDTVVLVLRL